MVTRLMGCASCGKINLVSQDLARGAVKTVAIVDPRASLSAFVAQECTLDPAARIDSGLLLDAYREWCANSGQDPLPPQSIGRALVALFSVERYRSSGRRFYLGIALRD